MVQYLLCLLKQVKIPDQVRNDVQLMTSSLLKIPGDSSVLGLMVPGTSI